MCQFSEKENTGKFNDIKILNSVYQKESWNDNPNNWEKVFVVHMTDKVVPRICKKNS